jgi:hypothetical protein
MTGRPDDSYEVAARLDARRSRRGRLLAALAALALVTWASVTVSARLGAGSSAGSSAGSESPGTRVGAGATRAPLARNGPPGPTYPPDVAILRDVPLGKIPFVLDGLAWLDPGLGELYNPGLPLSQWRFALGDGGAACVCIDGPRAESGAQLHLYRFGPSGSLSGSTAIGDWLPIDQPQGLVDAAITPDASTAIVAAVVRSGSGWDLRLQSIPFADSSGLAEVRIDGLDVDAIGDPANLVVRVYLAPDGSRVRVALFEIGDDLARIPGTELDWTVDRSDGRWGRFEGVDIQEAESPAADCSQQGWASATTFVEFCRSSETDAQGNQQVFVRIERGSELVEVPLGSLFFEDDTSWLLDGTNAVAYGWSSMSHHLYRLDLASDTLTDRLVAGAEPTLVPEASPGDPGATSIEWQPLGRASEYPATRLVGSSDGRLLYAVGSADSPSAVSGSGGPSSIWVIDSRSLALVGSWPALASYQSIALSANGRYVLALGNPGPAESRVFGNHGPELVIHDPSDGSAVAIMRSLVLRFGDTPGLLPAGPPVAGVSGSG